MAAEGVRDRPHVRARADQQVERDDAVGIGDDFERVHARPPYGHLDRDALAMEPVGALAADLHRRGGGDRQLDLTAEVRELFLELLPGRRRALLHDLALRVAGRGTAAKIDRGAVALVQSDEPWSHL